MKYPFTPDFLDALPERLADLFRDFELIILTDICRRLKKENEEENVTVQFLLSLIFFGVDISYISRVISEETEIAVSKLNEIFDDVISQNKSYYESLMELVELETSELVSDSEIQDIIRETETTCQEAVEKSVFIVDNGRTTVKPENAYRWAVNNAILQVQSGETDYNKAIQNAVKQLADSGLKVITYSSGHVDQIDVAVRRAVITGVNQLCQKYADEASKYLNTDYVEVSAHSGARDKPGPTPWYSHKDWQGRIYSFKSGDKYPSIYTSCGLGYVDGLLGANCRHHYSPFIDGVMQRTYTDEQLEHIDDGKGCTYQGRTYSAYEATQKQRQIERTIRKLKRQRAAYQAAGLKDEEQTSNIRLKRLEKEYKKFSKAAGLPEQTERTQIYEK